MFFLPKLKTTENLIWSTFEASYINSQAKTRSSGSWEVLTKKTSRHCFRKWNSLLCVERSILPYSNTSSTSYVKLPQWLHGKQQQQRLGADPEAARHRREPDGGGLRPPRHRRPGSGMDSSNIMNRILLWDGPDIQPFHPVSGRILY